MAKNSIIFEELPEAAQRVVRKTSVLRKITLFISLAIGVILGTSVASRASGTFSMVGDFILAFVIFCGSFQGAVHGINVYKRLIGRNMFIGIFLSVLAMVCYSALGGIYLAADILLFITGKPLVYPSELDNIRSF